MDSQFFEESNITSCSGSGGGDNISNEDTWPSCWTVGLDSGITNLDNKYNGIRFEMIHGRFILYNASRTLESEYNVFYAFDSVNKAQNVVVKLVPLSERHALQYELRVYEKLSSVCGLEALGTHSNVRFASVLFDNLNSHYWDPYNYLVLTNNGKSLETLHDETVDSNGKKVGFAIVDLCKLAQQGLDLLKVFHTAGFVHRDVHPANFLLENETLTLIDFKSAGYVSNVSKREEMDDEDEKNKLTKRYGSFRAYCSAAHQNRNYIPLDDLEAFGLMLIDLGKERLPWKKNSFKLDCKTTEAKVQKMADNRNSLQKLKKTCQALKYPPIFYNYIKYCRENMSMDSPLNYEEWRAKFQREEIRQSQNERL